MTGYPAVGSTVAGAAGQYRIDSQLGVGGMGAVFAATELGSHAAVALKFMAPEFAHRPDLAQRFMNEARAAMHVASEHVVKIYGVEQWNHGEGVSPFIVMELLRGRELDAVIDRESPVEPARAVHYALQILRALQVAHGQGVIHRDLKPTNCFLVSEDGDPDFLKLIDFGITKIRGEEGLTQTSTTLGTPAYMAPEQAKSAKQADARSDLWAVGVILYELLTRRRPFEGESDVDLVIKICTEPPLPLKSLRGDLPQGLVAAVEHALVKVPAMRFPNAESFAAALETFADGRSKAVLARMGLARGGTIMSDAPLVPAAMMQAPPPAPVPSVDPHAPTPPTRIEPLASGAGLRADSVVVHSVGGALAADAGGGQKTIIGGPPPEAASRKSSGTVVGDGASLAAAPVVASAPPAVVPATAAPYANDRREGGGRGALMAVLGIAAVALIGTGVYFAAFRGSGGSTASEAPSVNPPVKTDDGKGDGTDDKKKKKKSEDPAAMGGDDFPAASTGLPTPAKPTAPAGVPAHPSSHPGGSTSAPPHASTSPSTVPWLPPGWGEPPGGHALPPGTHPTASPSTTPPYTDPGIIHGGPKPKGMPTEIPPGKAAPPGWSPPPSKGGPPGGGAMPPHSKTAPAGY